MQLLRLFIHNFSKLSTKLNECYFARNDIIIRKEVERTNRDEFSMAFDENFRSPMFRHPDGIFQLFLKFFFVAINLNPIYSSNNLIPLLNHKNYKDKLDLKYPS